MSDALYMADGRSEEIPIPQRYYLIGNGDGLEIVPLDKLSEHFASLEVPLIGSSVDALEDPRVLLAIVEGEPVKLIAMHLAYISTHSYVADLLFQQFRFGWDHPSLTAPTWDQWSSYLARIHQIMILSFGEMAQRRFEELTETMVQAGRHFATVSPHRTSAS